MSFPDLTQGQITAILVVSYFLTATVIVAAFSIKNARKKHKECDCKSYHDKVINSKK